MADIGQQMHELCKELWPICRSITGNGFRESLAILQKHLPNMVRHEVPTGTTCFDWQVPKEWNIKDAYIIDPDGNKICNFKENNLHVMGYSIPVNTTLTLEELQPYLYSLEEQPTAIPYITSYYQERWGFCITHNQRQQLKDGRYQVMIDSELKDGSLTYGELIIPGETEQEIFLSTYLCHPSMANNELSGPVVTTFLAKWIAKKKRKYTCRIIIIPETIGSITYLSRNLEVMKKHIIAGFNISCVGDERAYSYLPSRQENTLADQAALHVLQHMHPDFKRYKFLERGSDERQYCSPGVDLPVCSVMRTKYGCYPEYHTSLDDLNLVTPAGLQGSFEVFCNIVNTLELNEILVSTVLCEPQMGKRGLYPTLSTKESGIQVRDMMNFLAYCDGCSSNLDVAEKIDVPLWGLESIISKLKNNKLLKVK